MTVGMLVVALLVKPSVVMIGASFFVLLLRRFGAATRHAIWVAAIGAVIVLPALAMIVPPLRIAPPSNATLKPMFATSLLNAPAALPASSQRARLRHGEPREDARWLDATVRLDQALIAMWALVAAVLVARRVVADVKVRRLIARSRRATGALADGFTAAVHERRVKRSVRLVVSADVASPAVGGIVQPVVILPENAIEWSDAACLSVFVHELSHVARGDCAINLIADLAAALYWVNPLVHVAARRMRAEAEQVCDDEVLRAGGEARGYAQLLVDFAHDARAMSALPRAASGMAHRGALESRVLAVLDSTKRRVPLTRSIRGAIATVSTLLALVVGGATLNAAVPPTVQGTEPDVSGDSLAAQASERVPMVIDVGAIEVATRATMSGPDSVLAGLLMAAVRRSPDIHSLVRERAAWALMQQREGRLLEPILDALDAGDWRVQAYAAWTIGVAGDHRALPKLVALMQHPVWRLRAMAAAVVRQHADSTAVGAMTDALTDPAWQVRTEAVEYFGVLRDPSHREQVRARLDDRHIAVRHAAVRALKML